MIRTSATSCVLLRVQWDHASAAESRATREAIYQAPDPVYVIGGGPGWYVACWAAADAARIRRRLAGVRRALRVATSDHPATLGVTVPEEEG